MNKEEWSEFLKEADSVSLKGIEPNERRIVRDIISELSKEGFIFISDHRHTYTRIELSTDIEVERYLKEQVQHVVTTYMNRIRPIKGFVKEEQLKALMSPLSLMETT